MPSTQVVLTGKGYWNAFCLDSGAAGLWPQAGPSWRYPLPLWGLQQL